MASDSKASSNDSSLRPAERVKRERIFAVVSDIVVLLVVLPIQRYIIGVIRVSHDDLRRLFLVLILELALGGFVIIAGIVQFKVMRDVAGSFKENYRRMFRR